MSRGPPWSRKELELLRMRLARGETFAAISENFSESGTVAGRDARDCERKWDEFHNDQIRNLWSPEGGCGIIVVHGPTDEIVGYRRKVLLSQRKRNKGCFCQILQTPQSCLRESRDERGKYQKETGDTVERAEKYTKVNAQQTM